MPAEIDTLAAVMGWWIEVRCSCGRATLFPVKLLAAEHGAHARPADLVARMRCGRCDTPPAEAALIDDPQADATGYACGTPPRRRVVRWSSASAMAGCSAAVPKATAVHELPLRAGGDGAGPTLGSVARPDGNPMAVL